MGRLEGGRAAVIGGGSGCVLTQGAKPSSFSCRLPPVSFVEHPQNVGGVHAPLRVWVRSTSRPSTATVSVDR